MFFSQEIGDYKICFDNKFSYISSKTVYFEILNTNEEEEYDDFAGIFGDEEISEEYLDLQVSDIEVQLNKIKSEIREGIISSLDIVSPPALLTYSGRKSRPYFE